MSAQSQARARLPQAGTERQVCHQSRSAPLWTCWFFQLQCASAYSFSRDRPRFATVSAKEERTPSRTVVRPSQTVTDGCAGDIRHCCPGLPPNCLIVECAGFLRRPTDHLATKQGLEMPFPGKGGPDPRSNSCLTNGRGLDIPGVHGPTACVTWRLSLFLPQTGSTRGAARRHQVRP